MIVLDEEIHDPDLAVQIGVWYKGSVISVKSLRPRTLVKDDSMPTLLRRVAQPTFVTINWTDFWRELAADRAFCIVCADLTSRQVNQVPFYLRRFLNLPQFKTKAARMGSVVLLRPTRIEFYRADRKIQTMEWTN